MPGKTPVFRASSVTAKTFCRGGLPSSTATACERKSGSARRIASTGKSGTKMQAKGMENQLLVVGYWHQKSATDLHELSRILKNQRGLSGNNPYESMVGFYPARTAWVVNAALAERTGLRSRREHTISASTCSSFKTSVCQGFPDG